MTVGVQVTEQQINQILQNDAIALREVCDTIRKHATFFSSIGLNGIEGAGFSAGDAATVQQFMNYLAGVAGCYYGTVQQGGSGGTGAILFNFDSALSPVWGGA